MDEGKKMFGWVLATAVATGLLWLGFSGSSKGVGKWSDNKADGALDNETTYLDSSGRYWVYGATESGSGTIAAMVMMRRADGSATTVPRPTVSMMGVGTRAELAAKMDGAT